MSRVLLKSVSLVSLMTLISRVLGFIRDLLAAQIFGVNASVDAFYIAFKIPNFMRNLFAEGSFSQAFVPVLSDYRQKQSTDQVLIFISHMAGCLGIVLLIVTLLGVWKANILVEIFSPGLDPYRFTLATEMLRITFPYMLLISLTAFVAAILNSYGQFGIPSFTPALLNVTLIITALGMAHWFQVPVKSQAWGVLIAGFLQLFCQIIALKRMGFLVMPRIRWKDEGVVRVLKLLLPALFGASMGQISILINTVLASFLITGSITWLYYSERLAYFPLGIFGVALATVILPHLSRQHADASHEGFSDAVNWGLKWNLIIGIPASIVMLMLAGPIITTLFYYGKFTVHDVLMTKKSVITYGLGLQAFMLVKILSSAFYARQDIKTPVTISMISLGINIILSFLLVWPLAHAGLALATSLGSWINVIILWVVALRQKIFSMSRIYWTKFLCQLFIANTAVAIFLWCATSKQAFWLLWSWQQRFLHMIILGIISLIIYAVFLLVLNKIFDGPGRGLSIRN